MKKHISKRIAALLMAMLMVVGLMPAVVSAAKIPTIEWNRKGSVELTKEIKERRLDAEGDPVVPEAFDYPKVENVEFYQWKVGDIVQVQLTDGSITIGYTNVNEDLLDKLGTVAKLDVPKALPTDPDVYSASALQSALTTAFGSGDQSVLRTLITTASNGTAMPKTNAAGVTKVENLDLGLYLFVETAWPAEITEPCAPFFISVPSNTSVDVPNHEIITVEDEWWYDIKAVPKNKRQGIKIDKWILNDANTAGKSDDDTLSKGEDYSIGDTVPYRIALDALDSMPLLKTYKVGDMLSPGLTFTAVGLVYGETATGANVPLTAGTHYSVIPLLDVADPGYAASLAAQVPVLKPDGTSAGPSNFVVEFITPAFKDLGVKRIFIEYTAVLNEKAAIYTAGNPNDVSLIYSKNTGLTNTPDELITVEPETPSPVVYTYKVAIVKALEKPGTTDPFDGITFELQDFAGNIIPVFKESANDAAGNPVYRVKEKPAAGDKGEAIAVHPTTGKVSIVGLGAGQYQLIETATAPGHTLLADPIIFTIQAAFTGEGFEEDVDGEYFLYESGKSYLADGIPVDLTNMTPGRHIKVKDATAITEADGTAVKMYVHKTNETGWNIPTLTTNFKVNAEGFIEFTVVNKEGFDLPHTGGIGTYIFTIGGILIIGAALLLIGKKKKIEK